MTASVRNERGAALVVAILFLLILSILMAVLHGTTLFEIFSSRHYQESQQAFYAAETGIRQALRWLGAQRSVPMNSAGTPWVHDTAVTPDTASWSPEESSSNEGSYRYYIEYLKDAPDYDTSAKIGNRSGTAKGTRYYYRITSEGISGDRLVRKRVQVVTTAAY